MRTWTKARVAVLCGLCGKTVPVGAPVQHVSLLGLRRPLWRCEGCAGSAPPYLPADLEPGRSTKRMTPIQRIVLPDFKAKAAEK